MFLQKQKSILKIWNNLRFSVFLFLLVFKSIFPLARARCAGELSLGECQLTYAAGWRFAVGEMWAKPRASQAACGREAQLLAAVNCRFDSFIPKPLRISSQKNFYPFQLWTHWPRLEKQPETQCFTVYSEKVGFRSFELMRKQALSH